MTETDVDWSKADEVEVAQGVYVKFRDVGQVVAGTVVRYSATGGVDLNGQPIPQLELDLLSTAHTYDKDDHRTDLSIGERVIISASQVNLRRGLEEANLKAGDRIRVEFDGTYSTAKGTGKSFKLKVIRGSANPWDD